MRRFTLWIGLGVVVAVYTSVPTLGQTNASNPNEPPTTRLALHPAEPPAIAMQHRLLPRYLDLVPGNAAVQYLKALPEGGSDAIKKHAERMEELLDQDRAKFQLEEAHKILKDFGPMFEFLQYASVREECDWDLPIREHELYSIRLPELQSMRQLGRYLALRARVQIADGELDKAVGTLRVGYAMARHVAKGPTLVNALVGAVIARMMNEQLLLLIEHPQAPNLYWSIAALPDPFIDVRNAMDLEADGVYVMFPQLKDLATANLTDEQWQLRLSEFAQRLNSFGPLMFSADTAPKDWKQRLALTIGVTVYAASKYDKAKADLKSYGWPKDQIDRMAMPQVILLHIGQTFEIFRDDQFKWFHVPYPRAVAGMNAAGAKLATEGRAREILPLATLLLPALSSARTAVVRLDREFAAIRTVEALRFYAAKHDGMLPAKLQDIQEVPVPLDPMTGKLFDYKLDGATATLEGKPPQGSRSEKEAFRYISTMSDEETPAATSGAKLPRTRDRDGETERKVQVAASEAAKALVDVFTTNPMWEIGEGRRQGKSINNMLQLGLAMGNYQDVHKHYPPAASVDGSGKPLLSWRVHVLPYVEAGELYRQFKLDEPWDSEHNKKLIEKMPEIYRVPALPRLPKYTTTYFVPVGKETIFHGNKGTAIKEITDGYSRTILLVEADADQAVIWTKPGDWQFNPKQPTRGLGNLRDDLFLATFGDGSVHRLVPDDPNWKDRIP